MRENPGAGTHMKHRVEKTVQTALLCWSGGKDSALALHEIARSGSHHVTALLTTITEDYDRISMHGVRSELLGLQAKALNLQVERVPISKSASNEEYETTMHDVLARYKHSGTDDVIFGDIFLEDLRAYRENNLAKLRMNAVFPLWKKDTKSLAAAFIASGFRAVLTCVDTQCLDAGFAGREYDASLLSDLPPSVDPCGENGEFHTFVYDGPIFNGTIPVARGETVLRDGRFCFCDLLPA